MKRTYFLLLCMALSLVVHAQHIARQTSPLVSHRFINTSMPEALSWLDKQSSDITINFIYDELEDFKVTADIRRKSIPEAIQTLIGFYPIKATTTETYGDGNTLPKEYHHQYISVECTQKMDYHYKGTVYDNQNQPLPFANIVLLNAQDSTYLNGGVSNESGVFVIPCNAPKVIARISYVGFKTLYKTCTDRQMGNIHLQPTSKNLSTVVIKGEKPLVTYRGDRLVAGIKGSLLEKGNNGETLLQQLPGVWAENGKISINGNSGTKIYIGDRLVQLSDNDLSTYLKGIRSENIDKVEIIAHPSAEYDAEGQGGIIRILLRDSEQGAELNLGSNFGLTRWNEIAPRASFAYHKGRWGIDVSSNGIAWSRGKDKSLNHVELKDQEVIYDTPSQGIKKTQNANTNLSIRYAISKKDELLLYGNLSLSKSKYLNEASTSVKATDCKQTDMQLHQREHNKQFAVSVNYTHRFDAEGNRNLKIMTDLARQYSYGNKQQYDYQDFDANGNLLSEEYCGQDIPSQYTIISAEGRYTHNTKHYGQWMIGAKESYTTLNNELIYSDKQGNELGKGYQYGYAEAFAALYLKYQISRKSWDLVVGLRGELDIPSSIKWKERKGKNPFVKLEIDGQKDLFPSIYFTKRIGSQHALSFSYSRRTQRVSYRNLLPERYHQSKYEITEGNPSIRPDYPNELSMTYTWRGKYMLGTEYTWSNNGFNALLKSTIEDGTPTYISTFTDGQRSRKLYFYLYAPVTVSKWWTMNFRPWGAARRESMEDFRTKSFCYGIVTNQIFTLPGDTRLTLLYIAKSNIKNGNYEELATNNLHATLTKAFCHDHWTVSLAAYNLFYKNALKMRYTMQDVYQTRKVTTSCPYVSLNINYNIHWGKQKRNTRIEHSNNEERGRL